MNIQIYKYTNIQIYKYTNIQIYKYTNIYMILFTTNIGRKIKYKNLLIIIWGKFLVGPLMNLRIRES